MCSYSAVSEVPISPLVLVDLLEAGLLGGEVKCGGLVFRPLRCGATAQQVRLQQAAVGWRDANLHFLLLLPSRTRFFPSHLSRLDLVDLLLISILLQRLGRTVRDAEELSSKPSLPAEIFQLGKP